MAEEEGEEESAVMTATDQAVFLQTRKDSAFLQPGSTMYLMYFTADEGINGDGGKMFVKRHLPHCLARRRRIILPDDSRTRYDKKHL